MVEKTSLQVYKKNMNTPDILTTRYTRHELPRGEALDDATVIAHMAREAIVMSELLGVVSHNAFKSGPDNILDGPIALGSYDIDTLASFKLLESKSHYHGKRLKNFLPALTRRGLIAMNMVQLDEFALQDGKIVTRIVEPFNELTIFTEE